MNVTPIRRPTLATLIWLPAGGPCVYRNGRRHDHASGAPITSFTDGEDVNGGRRGVTSNIDLGLRVRLVPPKSP